MSEDQARTIAKLLETSVPGIRRIALACLGFGDYCCVFRDVEDRSIIIVIGDNDDYAAFMAYCSPSSIADHGTVMP